jgi:serine/threonine-protein kinase
MGTVFLAVAQGPGGFNKLKVIKHLNEHLAMEDIFLRMFLEEARLSAKLNHPNIVQTNEVGFDGEKYFIEMEYLDGQSYESIIRRAASASAAASTGGLSRVAHLFILSQVLDGLHYAHELDDHDGKPLKIVHRDVSPQNIFVTYDGAVKILDFGIAKAIDSSSETRTGMIKGKARYMAPEQATRAPLDRRTDIFPVGVMLWQAVTGKRHWGDLGELDILLRLQAGQIVRARTANPEVPQRFDEICGRAMAARPEDRYPTAEAMQEELSACLEQTGERFGSKNLGRLVSTLFADRRASVKRTIELHLANSSPLGPVPVLKQAAGYGDTGPSAAVDDAKTSVEGPESRARAVSAPDQTRTDAAVPEPPPGDAKKQSKKTWVVLAGLATVLGGGWGVSQLVVRGRERPGASPGAPTASAKACTNDAECALLGPRALCSTSGACAVAAECVSNEECGALHGKGTYLCRKTDGRCIDLTLHGCEPHAEASDYSNDSAVFLGVMFPTSGPDTPLGTAEVKGVELARQDFARMSGGIPLAGDDSRKRPLAFVACDDSADEADKARYLVEDVGVPAIIGFSTSREVVDLARSELIPRRILTVVALPTSSIITTIPQPTNLPRLVWRTTANDVAAVPLVSALLRDLDEAAVRKSLSLAPGDPIRVALLHRGSSGGQAYASALYSVLRFNGKSAVENESDFKEIVYGDPSGVESKADYPRAVEQVLAFSPHVILLSGGAEVGRLVVPTLEAAWKASVPRPLYIASTDLNDLGLIDYVAKVRGRTRRFLGVNVPSMTLPNAQLVTRYNEVFSTRITTDEAPSAAYDSFYLVAYASAAARAKTLTGDAIALGIERLLPPGPPIDVGPVHILEALGSLRGEGRINLNGAMTPLDFSVSTGETPVDLVVTCPRVDARGRVTGEMDSGLSYSRETDTIVGSNRCR